MNNERDDTDFVQDMIDRCAESGQPLRMEPRPGGYVIRRTLHFHTRFLPQDKASE